MSRDDERPLFVTAWGETPEEATRRAEIKYLLERLERTGDMETAARLVELDPPGGDPDAGRIIANQLRNKRPDEKAKKDAENREIDRLYQWLRARGDSADKAYALIAEIYYQSDVRSEAVPIDSVKKRHQRWLQKARGQNF